MTTREQYIQAYSLLRLRESQFYDLDKQPMVPERLSGTPGPIVSAAWLSLVLSRLCDVCGEVLQDNGSCQSCEDRGWIEAHKQIARAMRREYPTFPVIYAEATE
jgi:hypothetical protein